MEPQDQQPENSAPSHTPPDFDEVPERFHDRYLFIGGHLDGQRMYVSPSAPIMRTSYIPEPDIGLSIKDETYRVCQLEYEGKRWKVYLLTSINESELIPILIAHYGGQGSAERAGEANPDAP